MPVNTMSQESIYSTLYAMLALSDSIFQIWITLTFAVLIATYIAERRCDRRMYLLVSGLYAFASVILTKRYKNLLVTRGFTSWPVPNVVSFAIGCGTFRFSLCRNTGHTLVRTQHLETEHVFATPTA